MFSDVAHVRAALEDRIEPALPDRWRIEPNLKNPPHEYLSPLVTFEFTRFTTTVNGQDLPPGQAAASIDLILGSPMTKDVEGEDDVDAIALTVIGVIDAESDIYWDTAEKQRLPDGQWVWRLHTTALTSTRPSNEE